MIWILAARGASTLQFLFRCLPRNWVDRIAVGFGLLAFDLFRLRRKVLDQNLKIAFPELSQSQRVDIGRASTISFARTCFEFLDADRVSQSAEIETRGEDILDQALAEGKGVYILCCHFGNWELMCQYGSSRFSPVHVVVKPIGKGALAHWVTQLRRRNGMGVIDRSGPAGELSATRAIFSALRAKEMVGFIVDQRRVKGAVAPFFGRNSYTNISLFQLWQRRPAPVIPVSLIRTGLDAFRFEVFPPVVFHGKGESEAEGQGEELRRNACLINETVEGIVRQAPEQYFWHHRRWKGFE